MSQKTVVIALGGNAMQLPGQKGTHENQLKNVDIACSEIYKVRQSGWRVVLTSGNGPQVGAIKLQNQAAAEVSPEMPLFCCGAMSQGIIGYWMQQSMGNLMRKNKEEVNVVTCLTQSIVDINDKAFQNPTKPVGRFYTEDEAKAIMASTPGKIMKEDAGRGWRVMVPSPRPQKIVEYKIIKQLIDNGVLVICTNGGGIPVIEKNGAVEGVDSVIDKDLGTSLLARELEADMLIILTDVANACLNYKTPQEEKLGEVSLTRMLELEAAGHFKAGSMGPKVRAAIEFVQATGNPAVITSLDQAVNAVAGKVGTRIVK